MPTAAFFTTVGIGTLGTGSSSNYWSYGSGTLLAGLDAQLGALEFKLPWGGGSGQQPNRWLWTLEQDRSHHIEPAKPGSWDYFNTDRLTPYHG